MAIAVSFGVGAYAQWSTDPTNQLQLADQSGDQVQAKVRPTPDGGAYISWFANLGTGYSVYLQRVDPFGFEKWAHNGILIASRSFSSTVDYDLSVDAYGNALIAFNDDRSGTNQITVEKVSPDGTLMWGAAGVTVSSLTATKNNPKVQPLTDGNIIVGWTEGSPSGIKLQKLNPKGVLIGSTLTITEDPAGTLLHPLTLSDMKPSTNGGFIILYVRPYSSQGTASKYLYTQRFDSNLAPTWAGAGASNNGGSPITLYKPAAGAPYTFNGGGGGSYNATQGGSIQTGYFPSFISDGSGGAIYSWYEIAGPRNGYVQHILADGTVKFQANGLPNFYTNNATLRLGAYAAYDAVNDVIYSASAVSSSPTQGNYRVWASKIDGTGSRVWGDYGVEVLPNEGSTQPSFVSCQLSPSGVNLFYLNTVTTGQGNVLAAGLDSAGALLWQHQTQGTDGIDITNASKGRLDTNNSTEGFTILGWQSPSGAARLFASRVNFDGSLGTTGTTVSGHVDLEDFDYGAPANELVSVDIYDGAVKVESHKAFLNASSDYTVPTHVATGTYTVKVKGRHWLAKNIGSVAIDGTTGASGLTCTLTNGDVDGDNTITVFDYGVLSDYFDQFIGQDTWLSIGSNGYRPADADLDGDDTVTVFDYGILSDHFDQSGD